MKQQQSFEQACITNMCVVSDNKGNVLALDKVKGNYFGTTFPGGHVEHEEIFHDSMIREVWEETGFTIENPLLCGVYHWHSDGVHNMIFVYKATKYSGELKSSDEGKVYWIPLEEMKKKELATGTIHIIEMYESDVCKECYMTDDGNGYRGVLY